MSLTPSQQRTRKERAARIQADIAPFMGKECCAIEVVNAGNHHYRLTGPAGGLMDYFASTARWSVHKSPEIRGAGLREMMLMLATLPPPPEPATASAPQGDLVTIFADGSYDMRLKVGGWGCWIKKAGSDAISKGGAFSAGVGSSVEAEARALANGLRLAMLRGVAAPGDTVMLQSDCQNLLAALMKLVPSAVHSRAPGSKVIVTPARRLQVSLRKSEGLASLVAAIEGNRFKIIVRHVKGHQGENANARAWVNTHTDKLAKEGLRRAREAARQGEQA